MKFNHLNVPTHWRNYWTRYPEGHTILEALISWVSQVDSMVDNQNNLNDKVEQFRNEIDAFIGRFDERLQTEVTQTLQDWQNSGFLDVVISEALQWQLDDYIATNEQYKISLETQLAQRKTYITPEMFGAVGDGITDDTQALQDMIVYSKKAENLTTIRSQKHKVYLTTQPLVFGAYQHFNFGNATIKATVPMDYVISIETGNLRWGRFENVTVDCNNLANKGFHLPYTRLFIFSGIQILNFNTIGFHSTNGNVIVRDFYIDKNYNENSITVDTIGMKFEGTDSKVYSVQMRDCKIGISNHNGINYFTNVHVWLIATETIKDSIAFMMKGSAVLTNCYADTYYIGVKNDNEQLLIINGLHVFENTNYYTPAVTDNQEPYIFYFTQDINNVDTYANGARKTKITSLSADMRLNGFTNKAKFSNLDGQTFSEVTGNYHIVSNSQLPSEYIDNLPVRKSTSQFNVTNPNFNIETNLLTKDERFVTGDLLIDIVDKALLTPNTPIRVATIPSGYYPKNTFFTTCTLGTDAGTSFIVCYLRVNSSTSGGRYLDVTIPDLLTSNTNAKRLRIHIQYEL